MDKLSNCTFVAIRFSSRNVLQFIDRAAHDVDLSRSAFIAEASAKLATAIHQKRVSKKFYLPEYHLTRARKSRQFVLTDVGPDPEETIGIIHQLTRKSKKQLAKRVNGTPVTIVNLPSKPLIVKLKDALKEVGAQGKVVNQTSGVRTNLIVGLDEGDHIKVAAQRTGHSLPFFMVWGGIVGARSVLKRDYRQAKVPKINLNSQDKSGSYNVAMRLPSEVIDVVDAISNKQEWSRSEYGLRCSRRLIKALELGRLGQHLLPIDQMWEGRRSTVSFRIPLEDRYALEQAACQVNHTMSGFMVWALLDGAEFLGGS